MIVWSSICEKNIWNTLIQMELDMKMNLAEEKTGYGPPNGNSLCISQGTKKGKVNLAERNRTL